VILLVPVAPNATLSYVAISGYIGSNYYAKYTKFNFTLENIVNNTTSTVYQFSYYKNYS